MLRLSLLASLLLVAGCDTRELLPGEPEPLCSAEFRQYVVTVLRPDGTPAKDLRTSSVVVTTGQTLLHGTASETGEYPVANDSHSEAFGSETRIVRFTASDADVFAMADFVFAFDGCHITKVSGPTQISARYRGNS